MMPRRISSLFVGTVTAKSIQNDVGVADSHSPWYKNSTRSFGLQGIVRVSHKTKTNG